LSSEIQALSKKNFTKRSKKGKEAKDGFCNEVASCTFAAGYFE
jgi:hypothetical protein